MLIELSAGLMVTKRMVSVRKPPLPKRWSEPNKTIFTCPFGCGISPVGEELGFELEVNEPICWVGTAVGGRGVAVGKYVAVGGRGWKGVAVAVASAGLNRRFLVMPTAAIGAAG